MPNPSKFGVFVPQGWRMDLVDIPDPGEKYEAMTRTAVEAERLGFDSIWLYDHFHTVPQPELESVFECWTATAGLARDTKTIRLGQMVTCNGYRNPALMAKIASTVDVMSHGRLDFGIGAGWYEHEYRAYGYDYPDAPTRLKMLAEALPIIRSLWTEDYATYKGKFYQVAGAINEPKGVQKPHPPIWIGGGGEKVTLKLVAQYGDACNISGPDPAVYQHKFAVLREHCDKLGRDYDALIRSANLTVFLLEPRDVDRAAELTAPYRFGRPLEEVRQGNFVGTPAELVSLCRQLEDVGVNYFIFYLPNAKQLAPLSLLYNEVVKVLRGL
ncbi:MAG TPA: LLM class F420-dependent oxidoreductase [Chloroflexia bacterium]|nr:LLM class F420-dependent oxidoreductase [Chloroflexia bacterium]